VATPIKFPAEVTRVVRHAADVATYEFRCPARRPRYQPGQFLHLALDPYDPSRHWPESRAFTIANGASNRELLRLTIAAKGRFTRRILAELQCGAAVWMKAPYGDFIIRAAADQQVVLLAGGTGVTPFVAFMEDALRSGIQGEVWLHYGARRPELLVFADLAAQCAARFANFHLQLYAEEDARDGVLSGRISLDRACAPLRCPPQAAFYLCGPQLMITSLAEQLQGRVGVPSERIYFDRWE
jgi:ferredoxin-NADP reductase